MTLVIILALGITLFALAYLTKRRFGVLGLGLAAGLVLSDQLTRIVSTFFENNLVPVQPLAYTTAANVILVLLPALVMLLSGPRYGNQRSVVLGSLGFAVFALTLLLGPLARDLPITDGSVRPTLSFIAINSTWIIVIGIVAAIADMLHTHSRGKGGKRDKH